jgi:HK97 family phage prohead protease
MQHKSIDLMDCDLKFEKDDSGVFEGYLSVFDSVDSYGDTVIKGAYAETLKDRKRMPPMLLNHDAYSIPIGVWKSMKEDNAGLRVVGEMTKGNPISEQAFASMKHGALTGLSIGYRATKFEENDHGGLNLLKIDLREGSVVTMPAEDDARIDVVKLEDFGVIESVKDFEYILREAGFSKTAAMSLIRQFKEVSLREVGDLQKQIQTLMAEIDLMRSDEQARQRLSRLRSIV